MRPNGISEVLNRPIGQELPPRDVTRPACVAKDGTPRNVPIAFTWLRVPGEPSPSGSPAHPGRSSSFCCWGLAPRVLAVVGELLGHTPEWFAWCTCREAVSPAYLHRVAIRLL